MALVVFLRGVNVGGHKTFRPAILAGKLKHLDTVNIGAAGTFVVRKAVSQSQLRAEFAHRLPFDTQMVICRDREFLQVMSDNPFARLKDRDDAVYFVSILLQRSRLKPALPISFPSKGMWLVRILARRNQFIFGMYRRDMKTISYLGNVDRLFGVPVTTRNWNTVRAIAKVLGTTMD